MKISVAPTLGDAIEGARLVGTHRLSYLDIFVVAVLLPLAAMVVVVILVTTFGSFRPAHAMRAPQRTEGMKRLSSHFSASSTASNATPTATICSPTAGASARVANSVCMNGA